MFRVVVDTNTLISGIFWRGLPRQLYRAAIEGHFKPLATESLFVELERVIHYDKFQKVLTALAISPDDIVAGYREAAEIVVAADLSPDVVRDPLDVAVLACAVGGKADFIVSGDKDLLVLTSYENIPILTAEQFLERLANFDE